MNESKVTARRTIMIVALGGMAAHQAFACWQTVAQTDDNGNPITACDEGEPSAPQGMCAETATTMNDPLTNAMGGFPHGGTGPEMRMANCQKSWMVDGDGDGQCNDVEYTSLSVAVTAANSNPCPAVEPGGPVGPPE